MSKLGKAQHDENGKWIAPYGGGTKKPKKEFEIKGQAWKSISTKQDFLDIMTLIEATRTAKSHALNDRSSRSHCLVILK